MKQGDFEDHVTAGGIPGADDAALARTAEVFRALSNVSRLRLLSQLAAGPSGVTDLVIDTGLAQPLVSAHLKTLRELRLVKVERIGRTARYSLNDDHVAHVIADAVAHAGEDG